MIIVQLMGGLGNQMFQYAAGKALASRRQQALAFDFGYLLNPPAGVTRRELELAHFPVAVTPAAPGDIARLLGAPWTRPRRSMVRKILDRLERVSQGCLIEDRGPESFESLVSGQGEAYLSGFWQSEKVFADISDEIRSDFKIDTLGGVVNDELLRQIEGTDSVGVHVRRGDYASDQATKGHHGLCSVHYYQSACLKIAEILPDATFFVFSDEPEWCKDNLDLGVPLQIVGVGDIRRPIDDLRLMSRCSHNIIANSSFSWWAAWLNSNPEKRVVAPLRWLAQGDPYEAVRIPAGWIRI